MRIKIVLLAMLLLSLQNIASATSMYSNISDNLKDGTATQNNVNYELDKALSGGTVGVEFSTFKRLNLDCSGIKNKNATDSSSFNDLYAQTFYCALTDYYKELYNADPKKFNAANYKDFYARFKDSAIKKYVFFVMLDMWQTPYHFGGDFFKLDAKKMYDGVAKAMAMGLDDKSINFYVARYANYHQPDFWNTTAIDEAYGRLYSVARNNNDMKPFYKIKKLFFDFFIKPFRDEYKFNEYDSERWGFIETDFDFIKVVWKFAEAENWKKYAIAPATKAQQRRIAEMVKACDAQFNEYCKSERCDSYDKKACRLFKETAFKAGFYVKTDAEKKAERAAQLRLNPDSNKHPRLDWNGTIGPNK